MRRLFKISTVVAVALGLCLLVQSVSFADTASDEDRFVQSINASRAANGLGPLTVDGQLVGNARAHSADMSSQGTIFHNSSLANQITGNWIALGENVGMGPTVDDLHAAFMASTGHRANILGDYDRVGVGEVLNGSTIYVTEVFWKSASASIPIASLPPPTVGPTVGRSCRRIRGRTVCRSTRRRRRRRAVTFYDWMPQNLFWQ
ncbi:MAG: CAP domain-containing protein [Actinomycetota bacterium]|nr:CAP domain-containing protein [Actinomycetota bacterium]